ncbi:MAG: hypothetical protein WAK61_21725 [Leclercia sp.]
MNTKLVLKEKAALISHEKCTMDKLWNAYSMALLTRITATERVYHHQVVPYQKDRLRVKVFGDITINIVRCSTFGAINVEYRVESTELGQIDIPSACIHRQGILDKDILLADGEQVFDHYLNKLNFIYNHILQRSAQAEQG